MWMNPRDPNRSTVESPKGLMSRIIPQRMGIKGREPQAASVQRLY